MQTAAIEFARYALGYAGAHSQEFDPASPHKIIAFMADQSDELEKGGTMRLGAYPCLIQPHSRLASLYGCAQIQERHRHRYEFNNAYREEFEAHGMRISGTSPDGHLVEAIELADHPYFVAVQYHPEFKSRPNKAHPLFSGLIAAALKRRNPKKGQD